MGASSGSALSRARPSGTPLRLGVVAAQAPDPWDVAIYPELETLGIAPTILGKLGEENPVPTMVVETAGEANPWRRIGFLRAAGHTIHGLAVGSHIGFLPSPFAVDDAVVGLRWMLQDFDIALAFETYRASTYQACKAHPAVVVKTTENIVNHPPHIPFPWFKRCVRERARWIVCVSELAREALCTEGFDGRRISIIPEPVDTRKFRPVESAPGDHHSFTVGFAGRLTESHGILDLFDAFAEFARGRDVCLKIAGSGPLSSGLVSAVTRRNLQSRVEYLGQLKHCEMPSFLNSIDVLCVPCREVPGWRPQFGIVNIEAMACKKPIIATRCGATPEIVPPGLQRFLVTPGDTTALKARLETLAADAGLVVELGNEAREWVVRRYDSRLVADQWASLIRDVVDEFGSARMSRRGSA